MIKTGFITAFGINYTGTLPKIKKSSNELQPLFEAFTNSLESLELANKTEYQKKSLLKKSVLKTSFLPKKENSYSKNL